MLVTFGGKRTCCLHWQWKNLLSFSKRFERWLCQKEEFKETVDRANQAAAQIYEDFAALRFLHELLSCYFDRNSFVSKASVVPRAQICLGVLRLVSPLFPGVFSYHEAKLKIVFLGRQMEIPKAKAICWNTAGHIFTLNQSRASIYKFDESFERVIIYPWSNKKPYVGILTPKGIWLLPSLPRHQDMSSVGSRMAAADSLGLQSGLRGWQRLPVNRYWAKIFKTELVKLSSSHFFIFFFFASRRVWGYEPLLRALYERGPVGVSVAAGSWQLGDLFLASASFRSTYFLFGLFNVLFQLFILSEIGTVRHLFQEHRCSFLFELRGIHGLILLRVLCKWCPSPTNRQTDFRRDFHKHGTPQHIGCTFESQHGKGQILCRKQAWRQFSSGPRHLYSAGVFDYCDKVWDKMTIATRFFWGFFALCLSERAITKAKLSKQNSCRNKKSQLPKASGCRHRPCSDFDRIWPRSATWDKTQWLCFLFKYPPPQQKQTF